MHTEMEPLYPSFPVESPELLTELMTKRRFSGSQTRLNVARGKETFVHKGGREFLVDKINSDVVKAGPLFHEVRRHHPWVEQLTLNKNLLCTKHTDRNEGTSLICFLGDFSGGGGLFVEEPDGVKHFREKNTWYEYNGRHPHWTEPWFEGNRYSIVAYKKPKPTSKNPAPQSEPSNKMAAASGT